MNWKMLILFFFCVNSTITHAETLSKQGSLFLRGIVPVKNTITLVENRQGDLVPTLQSNSPAGVANTIHLKTFRAPASLGNYEKVIIESH